VKCMGFTSMNTLRGVNFCFINSLVYMDYLIFLQRLKHGGLELSEAMLAPPLVQASRTKRKRPGVTAPRKIKLSRRRALLAVEVAERALAFS
jgi:hypothetical protein